MKSFFLSIVFHVALIAQAESVEIYKLKQEIARNNVELKFDASIAMLHKVLSSSQAGDWEKYEAHYLKYQIYKLMYNYSEAIHNLNAARAYGIRTLHKDQVNIKHELELLLLACEQANYAFVAANFQEKNSSEFLVLSARDRAVYLLLQAVVYLEAAEPELVKAASSLDESIKLFIEEEAEYLPIVYRTKIKLHGLMNQEAEVMQTYRDGIQWAKKHNRVTYLIDLHRSLSDYYRDRGNFKASIDLTQLILESVTEYNAARKSSELKVLENQLNEEQVKILLEKRTAKTKAIAALAGLLALVMLSLVVVFKRRGKKLLSIEEQNSDLNFKLLRLDRPSDTNNTVKGGVALIDKKLTLRQKAIVELAKEGKTNRQIAEELFISENTVKYHLKTIYELLNIKKRTDL